MDIITQGLMGAVVAQAGATPKEARLAACIGFFAPLLADADVLIRSLQDPLLSLEYHRHFTHALLFIPIGALLASLVIWPLLHWVQIPRPQMLRSPFSKQLTFKKIYFYAFLGYATAGFLDACTSYGTYLLWPFSDERIAWSIISIFDPTFSLLLIAALSFGFIKYKPRAAQIGIVLSVVYWSIGVIQHHRAETLAHEYAQQRGHTVERLIVKPTIGNLLLWRSVYEVDKHYVVDAIRAGLFNTTFFTGGKIKVFDINVDFPTTINQTVINQTVTNQTTIYHDIKRFELFSDGFLVWHPEHRHVLGDIRFAMLPTSTSPLWGIELSPEKPNQHITYNTYRTMTENDRQNFFNMLLNKTSEKDSSH
ncbi:MAG: metal-dependent hydrolase [Cellvibrionaceae bacterium]